MISIAVALLMALEFPAPSPAAPAEPLTGSLASGGFTPHAGASLAARPTPAAEAGAEPSGEVEVQVVEHLKLKVPAVAREVWLEAEASTWESWLARQEGFLGRDLFWDREREEGILLIHWASRRQWKAISQEEVERVQQDFARRVRAILKRLQVPDVLDHDARALVDSLDPVEPFPLVHEGELSPLRVTPAPPQGW